MCIGDQQWTKSLPLIMLGLRTAFREDFQSTSAELVYGENLRLPGDFIQASNVVTQNDVILKLRKHFETIRPSPPSRHNKNTVFVFKDLQSCSHVLVRTDALRTSLQVPYEGPFPVVSRSEKYFTVLVKGLESNISINRLKPCFMEQYDNSPVLVPSVLVPSNSNNLNSESGTDVIKSSKPKGKSVTFATNLIKTTNYRRRRN